MFGLTGFSSIFGRDEEWRKALLAVFIDKPILDV
jgi:hypothetical protein